MNNMNNNLLISIEGNIGSGKSTLLGSLKKQYEFNPNVIFLDEPVDEWSKITNEEGKSILELFYSNQERYSFSFQMLAYITRLQKIKEIIEKYNNKILVSERSLFTDSYVFAKMLYETKKISEVEYKIYTNWVTTFSNYLPEIIIYLNTSPELCEERVNTRKREGEDKISLTYLTDCHNYHEKMITELSRQASGNIYELNGNINIYEDKNTLNYGINLVNSIVEMHIKKTNTNSITLGSCPL